MGSRSIAELASILKAQHAAAPESRKVASIHLFGIEHAASLGGISKYDIAELAGLSRSYGTEISKGAVLGEYVTITTPLV